MEPLLVFPDPPPPDLVQTLDLGGWPWKAVGAAELATRAEPADGWSGAVVMADRDPEGAFALCRALRKRDVALQPLLLLVSGTQLGDLELRDDLFDDFGLSPFHPRELEARLQLPLDRLVHAEPAEVFELLLARRTGHDHRARV